MICFSRPSRSTLHRRRHYRPQYAIDCMLDMHKGRRVASLCKIANAGHMVSHPQAPASLGRHLKDILRYHKSSPNVLLNEFGISFSRRTAERGDKMVRRPPRVCKTQASPCHQCTIRDHIQLAARLFSIQIFRDRCYHNAVS